jgi:FkbM family methyltransferase
MSLEAIKKFIRKSFHRAGLDLKRYRPEATESYRLMRLLRTEGVDLVVDVGANHGGFATKMRDGGYRGDLISFEPLEGAHQVLQMLKANDSSWVIAPRMALGEAEGQAMLHVAGNSSSSSLLPMLDAHQSAAPASAYIAEEPVPLRRLDMALPALAPYSEDARIFLKIDTQGYERQVLEGAHGLIPQIHAIQLELSLLPLYEGQWLLDDFLPYMKGIGFILWSLSEVFVDPRTGRLLQVDGIFARESLPRETPI